MTVTVWAWLALGVTLCCLGYAGWLAARVVRVEGGSEVMRDILELVHAGAVAFARHQYSLLLRVAVVMAAVLALLGTLLHTGMGWKVALAYLAGVFVAGVAGHLGMLISTRANARTTNLAAVSLGAGFRIAFQAGSVTGLVTVGLGLLGLCGAWLVLRLPMLVSGVALGVSTFALFARVSGGTFAKATDVGSELACRLEGGIPEDDLQNPGAIADEIGANVSGVTGMGADVVESVVGASVAAMALGVVVAGGRIMNHFSLLPLLVGAAGLVASLGGQWLISRLPGGVGRRSLRYGNYLAAPVVLAALFFLCAYLLPGPADGWTRYLGFFWSGAAGWITGMLCGWLARSNVSPRRTTVRSVVAGTREGPALSLIRGLALGMRSVAAPSLLLAALIGLSYHLGFRTGVPGAGWYAVSVAIVALLSTAGLQVAVGAYGPITDNAYGIAKMSGASSEVLERTRTLDSLGTSGAAAARGYAGAAAALTSLILIVAYFEAYRTGIGAVAARNLPRFDLLEDPALMIGLLLGGLLPYLFSFFTLANVSRVAGLVVGEVHRQFEEIPGLRGGSAPPDLATCVSIAIVQAHKGMAYPALLALAVPTVVGLVSPMALGGVLVGATLSGFLLSSSMTTAGGVWGAARQIVYSEDEPTPDTQTADAVTVAHLFGDPLKESSGPAIHTLIKLMSMTALVLAPVFVSLHG